MPYFLRVLFEVVAVVMAVLAWHRTTDPTSLGPMSGRLVRAVQTGDTVQVYVDSTGAIVMRRHARACQVGP